MDNEKLDETNSWNCWLRTLFIGSGAMMVYVFTAISEAQSAVLLPQLKGEDSHIHITPDQESWIASLGLVLSPLSALLGGSVIDAFGRKRGLQFFYFNMSIGFGVIACATEVSHVYIGRVICSLGPGLEMVPVVYLAEICTEKQRSFFFSILLGVYASGMELTSIVGGYLPWNIASAIFSFGCIFYLILECFMPESPAWLFKMGKEEASTDSLRRLGRSQSEIHQELKMLKLSIQAEAERFHIEAFLHPTVWKPFVVLLLFHFLQNASGFYSVLHYTVDFAEHLGTTYNPLTISILLFSTKCLTSVTIGIYFMASVGRKFATAFSAFGMTVVLLGAGVYEYIYRDTSVIERPFQWLPVTLIVLSIITSSLGVTSLPWIMGGEMFPLRVRGAMNGVVYALCYCFMFGFVKAYRTCMDVLQIWGLLFSFAAASFATILFGIYVLPETQNKTLYEIEQSFLPKKKRQQDVEQVASTS